MSAAQAAGPGGDDVPDGNPPERLGGRILVIDLQTLLGETLAHVLVALGTTIRVTGRATYALTANEAARFQPELIIVEVGPAMTPDDLGHIAAASAHGRVLALGPAPDDVSFAAWVGAGACGRLDTDASLTETTRSIDDALRDRRMMDLATEQRLATLHHRAESQSTRNRSALDALTEREQAVLRSMIDGLSAAEIAESSFVSVATVRTQIQSVLRKLRVKTQLAAVAEAHRQGWCSSERIGDVDAAGAPLRTRRSRQPLTLG